MNIEIINNNIIIEVIEDGNAVQNIVSNDGVHIVEIVDVGLRGEKGETGDSIATYQHIQSSASDLWVINHNLNKRCAVNIIKEDFYKWQNKF